MPLECGFKERHGREFCVSDCPAARRAGSSGTSGSSAPGPAGRRPAHDRRGRARHEPRLAEPRPRLARPRRARRGLRGDLRARGGRPARAGAVVRRAPLRHAARGPGPRFSLYLGTGGPGHLDPRANDGVRPGAQGILEDPCWEAPAFALFDAIRADDDAALIAVCHTFGVMCRWSGAAAPALRGPEKGKCSGVLENMLALPAAQHPWFRRFAELWDRAPAARGREPPVRPDPAGRRLPGRVDADRLRDARRGRRAGRRRHDDRVRARRERRDAAHVRGQPPPRDRRPLPPDDDPRPEARARRGERGVVSRAARDPDAPVPRRGRRPAAAPDLGLHAARAAALPPVPRAAAPRARRSRCRSPLHEDRVVQALLGEPVGAGRSAEVF